MTPLHLNIKWLRRDRTCIDSATKTNKNFCNLQNPIERDIKTASLESRGILCLTTQSHPLAGDAPVPEPAQGERSPLQHRGKTLVLAACRIVSALSQLSQRVSTFTSVTLKGHRFLEGQQLED